MIVPKRFARLNMVISLACFSLAAQGAERDVKAASAKASAQPNLQFLEYLGTLEGDEENWTDVGEAVVVQAIDARTNKVSAITAKDNGPQGSKERVQADAETAKPVERK